MKERVSLARRASPALTLLVGTLTWQGCAGASPEGIDGFSGVEDAAVPGGSDARSPVDAGLGVLDSSSREEDAWARAGEDAGAEAERCTGGLDEDRDREIDCNDADCVRDEVCVAADVTRLEPGLVPCGAPIALDADSTRSACRMLRPGSAMWPNDCEIGESTVAARIFCDSDGEPTVLWVDQWLVPPPFRSRMIDAQTFELSSHQRASPADWERKESGFSSIEGGLGPTREVSVVAGSVITSHVVTVRRVSGGDVFMRLLGMSHVVSVVNRDSGRSTETRTTFRTAGMRIEIPRR
jgi:hypothetical protein